MTTTKTNQEKSELFKALWAIACEVRGSGVTGWDFKSYILNTLFYRYLSERLCKCINDGEKEAGDKDFDYAELGDDDIDEDVKNGIVDEIGYFLYPSELFQNVVKTAKGNPKLNNQLNKVFENIENSAKGHDSENCFSKLFNDFDLNSESRLGNSLEKRNETLANLLIKIAEIDFGGDYLENQSDIFGDAYEYLMGMYASDAGQKGGEFFTPQEVSKLLAKICLVGKKRVNKVYDLTCGSGSLLLQPAKILGDANVDIGYFGQEVNTTTYNLCRMNMILHGIGYDKIHIACDDTLTNPKFKDDEPFEVIVSNPPYSVKWVGDDDTTLINDERFAPAGKLAPKSKADFAFIMHANAWLAENGVASIVCFPGILYRGGAEQTIRQYLVDNNRIDTIIQLPSNLFFGTSIATCIMVLKKNKVDNKITFIDASEEFLKETKQNKLSEENIETILNWYKDRKDVDYRVKVASYEEVKANKYNLSVATYVEKEDKREKIDITELNKKLKEVVEKENQLRKEIDEIIEEIE